MRVNTQSIHFTADSSLLEFVEKKVSKLETFYGNIINGEVFLRLENSKNKENKVVEIKLTLPGSSLFVKERSSTFEAAVDKGTETLKKQVKRLKGKLQKAS